MNFTNCVISWGLPVCSNECNACNTVYMSEGIEYQDLRVVFGLHNTMNCSHIFVLFISMLAYNRKRQCILGNLELILFSFFLSARLIWEGDVKNTED